MRLLGKLTKSGMIVFVVLSAVAGYWLGFRVEHIFEWDLLAALTLGVAAISAGSFALNQAQEWALDQKMPRTQSRPIPSGKISPSMAALIGVLLLVTGSVVLYLLKPLVAVLGLLTVALYNGFYTMYWKPKWTFGAVPGALPGAMPVVIGYAAANSEIFSPDCIYAFLIMFLWQMPHFWALAIRFKEDYRAGGVPTLPVVQGTSNTLYYIALYVLAYVGVAIGSPWLVGGWLFYLFVVVPFCLKVLWEFLIFYKSQGRKNWLSFFLWTNFSMLAFLVVPILDRWAVYFVKVKGF